LEAFPALPGKHAVKSVTPPFKKQCAGNDLPVRRSMYTDYCAWGVPSCARFFLPDSRRRQLTAEPRARRKR
jgi:hypothetical protein